MKLLDDKQMWEDFQNAGKNPIVVKKRPPLTLSDAKKNGGETWRDRVLRMLRPLDNSCRACSMCELGRDYGDHNQWEFDPHVFSNMKPSKWMVVGQNPGHNECIKGEPFVGESGKTFDAMVKKGGLSRDDFYITNAVKCYTKKNATPLALHKERCEPFLRMEIGLLRPKLIVTLGSVGFSIFCPELKMSDNLGKIVKSKKFDMKVYPVYHPSPRNMNAKGRREKFEKDILTLCKLIKKANTQAT